MCRKGGNCGKERVQKAAKDVGVGPQLTSTSFISQGFRAFGNPTVEPLLSQVITVQRPPVDGNN